MSTALTVYMTTTASTTISTANTLLENASTTSSNTNKNSNLVAGQVGWGEEWSQGNASNGFAGGSEPSPDARGWCDDGTVLENNHFDTGTWTGTVRLSLAAGSCTADLHLRAYQRSSGGTYTLIAEMTATGQSLTTTQANFTCTASSVAASNTFATGDKLYIDLIINITASSSGGNVKMQMSSSATLGYTSAQVVTPGYLASTQINKDIVIRGRISAQVSKDVALRGRIKALINKDVAIRGRIQQLVNKDAVFRGRIQQLINKDILLRGRIQQLTSKDVKFRGNVGLQSLRDVLFRGRIQQLINKDIALRGRIQQLVSKDINFRGKPANTVDKDIVLRARISNSVTKDILFRARIQQLVSKDIALRGKIQQLVSKDLAFRAKISNSVTKDIALRGRIRQIISKDVALRGRIRQIVSKDIAFRGNISAPVLTSGGFTLFGSGTGTAQYDHFRVTQYPDPALSLSPIVPYVGVTSVAWNALVLPNTTLGVDIGYDGVNWIDVSAGNGASLPAIFSQPDPTIDGFDTNSAANYTTTNQTGGAAGTITYDTANSRIAFTGGTNALFVFNAISRADVDFFADMDRSDAGGLVWRYVDGSNFYYLLVGDSLASSGTKNAITLFRVAANVQTQLATATISIPNTPISSFIRTTVHRFRVTMFTSTITCYVDGTALITYTDVSPLSAAGKMGLYNNGGTTGSRYYQLWLSPQGDYVSGTPATDVVTAKFVYTRLRLATTDPSVTPQVTDLTTFAANPDIGLGVLIPAVTYASSFVNVNFDDLAKQSNYAWYVAPAKNLVFRTPGSIAAPWIAQSTAFGVASGVDIEMDSNFELDVANDLYRNRHTILGVIDTLTTSAIFVGDGSTRSFTLGYPLAVQPTITLNGVAQTVGLKGTSGSNWYWAYNDATIQQDISKTILQSTDQLSLPSYTGLFETKVTVDNVVEQAARALVEGGTGIVEMVEDFTGQGMTKAAALTRAQQLITRYAISGRTLIFRTARPGLDRGQTLSMFIPEHGVWDGQFIVTDVEIKLETNYANVQTWWYKVTVSELPKQASWAKLLASGLGIH